MHPVRNCSNDYKFGAECSAENERDLHGFGTVEARNHELEWS